MAGPIKTTVADTIYAPDGNLPTGRLIVSTIGTWTSADGFVILQGFSTWVPVTDGVFSIDLVPNQGSSPVSTYKVHMEMTEGYFFSEWSVPQPGSPPLPVTLADVIVA